MKNYLVLNGQKIELTPEQYQEVCNAVSPKKSPFGRKERNEIYYYIGDDGFVYSSKDRGEVADTLHYGNANYCSDKNLMKKRSNYEALERILWRFSEDNGGAGSYTIYINIDKNRWGVLDIRISAILFGPTFCSRQVANKAIEVAEKWLSSNNLEPEDVFF